jgi:hypothetical protein
MNPLVNANQSQQPTGGNPYDTKDIGGSNARLANMQKALAGGRKRKSTKGGAAPGALPNGGTVVATFPNASGGENGVLVDLAKVQLQAEANRTFTGGKQSGGGRKKGRKSRKSHKKRRVYKKKTRRRYKY